MIRSSHPSALVAGVDSSTQSTKVAVVDVASGVVVARGDARHLVTGTGGARETDPALWWQALATAIGRTGRGSSIAAISIAGQQHGLVVQDAAGAPLRPAILWNDTRAAPDALALRESLGSAWWADVVGVVPVASFTAAKLAWLRRCEPAVAAAIAGVRLPHDHLTERLCGEAVTDRSDASGTAWWSAATGRYVDEVLGHALVSLDRAALPRVLAGREQAGVVGAVAAGATGLRSGIPVGAGAGDNAAAALGLGIAPGEPVVSLGTSGTVFARSTTRTTDPSGVVAGFADASGGFLPLACTLNATLAIERLAGWLGIGLEAVEPSGGVVVLPYLDGERTPDHPLAAGLVTGLRHSTTPGAILMAAYEGAVASLVTALDEIGRRGAPLDDEAPIVLVGGGARGSTWRSVVARLTGRAIVLATEQELVAYGAAAQAAALLTGEDPVAIARRWSGERERPLPAGPRDDATLARVAEVSQRARALLDPT
jgi:xylulokinase